MSRKHYIQVAKVLAAEYAISGPTAKIAVRNIAYSLADAFCQDDARFDRQRFYDAVFGDAEAKA